jgi:transposase
MPAERLSMRKVREVLRLRSLKVTVRKIALSLHMGASTVGEYLERAKEAGLAWPFPEDLSDRDLETRLFPSAGEDQKADKPLPEWSTIHRELKKKGVTKFLVWQEYKAQHPEGYQYSQFCTLYQEWESRLHVWMRQPHLAGDKLFVDFSGDGIPYIDPRTGEAREAALFVAVLGASNYTFAFAVPTEQLPDWIEGHVKALAFFGGVPNAIVPDQPKTAIARSCRYDPDVNPSYAEFARHYDVTILPARPRKPRDKAKVEGAVLLAQRWILAVLRHRQFFSVAEINEAIREPLEKLNGRLQRRLRRSRTDLFLELDRPHLRPLPETPYEYSEWKFVVRVNLDYHVEFAESYYSVPYQLAHQPVDIRATGKIIRATGKILEIFHQSQRVASHLRSYKKHSFTTDPAHMPSTHRAHAEWTPERLANWAKTLGPNMVELVESIMKQRALPEQGFRACMGIMHLQKHYPLDRMEKAARRAVACRIVSYKGFKGILENRLEEQPLPHVTNEIIPPHRNVRGSEYYRQPSTLN